MPASDDSSIEAHRTSSPGVTCGVSMPISRVGSGFAAMASANAAASRVPRSPSAWGTTVKPSRSRSPGAPSSATTRPATGAARTASRVSPTAAAAMPRGLLRRARRAQPGLAPAGHRRLRDHQHLGAVIGPAPPRMSRTVRTVPEDGPGHLRLAARRPEAVVDVDLLDAPAGVRGAGDHLQRVAEPPVGDPERRAAPRGARPASGPRSCSRSPVRARIMRASATLATRACTGQAPRDRAPPAEHEVGRPGAHRVQHPGELRGVHRAVRVAEAHERRRRGLQAGMRRGAEAALRHGDDGRAVRGGDRRRAVGRSVVGHDRAVAGRQPGQHPGQRRGLVETGEDDVDR